MSCIETDTLLSVAEALGEHADRKAMHIAECSSCRDALADLSEWRAALAPAPLPPQVTAQVAQAVSRLASAPHAADQNAQLRKRIALTITTAAVVMVTLAAAVSFLQVMLLSYPVLFLEYWLNQLALTSVIGVWVAWRGWRAQVRRSHTFASP
jgi:hypothetical protein